MPHEKELKRNLPPKTSKSIHRVYGKALGYRCPACKVKGYGIPPNALYGGSGCHFCQGTGRILSKEKWLKYVNNKLATKPIKQEEKSDCCAAVAAMLTGSSSMELFKKHYGPTPKLGYWNVNLFDYAEAFGWFIDRWYEGKYFRGRLKKGKRAYVVVVSERYPNKTHALYWDGYQIYDPSPLVENGRDIKTYDVIRVVYFTKDGRPRKERWKKTKK